MEVFLLRLNVRTILEFVQFFRQVYDWLLSALESSNNNRILYDTSNAYIPKFVQLIQPSKETMLLKHFESICNLGKFTQM